MSRLRLSAYLALAVLLGVAGALIAQTVTDGRVGPVYAGDGSNQVLRQGRNSELIIQQAGGKYSEAVQRGNCYSAMTAATGVSVASLTITTTGQATLANPAGSNRNARVMSATGGYVSGTFGAGNLVYALNVNPNAAAVTGTAVTPTNLLAGSVNTASCKFFTTSTLPATPTAVRNFTNIGAWVGTTASPLWNVYDDVDGSIIVGPGAALSITGTTAAGTSPLMVFSLTWEEYVP